MTGFALVSTVRAPVEDVLAFANYHLNIGATPLYLFFDDSLDPAADALAGNPGVVCTRCDSGYWRSRGGRRPRKIEQRQVANADLALEWARQAGLAWLAHVDSDELIYPGEASLQDRLEGVADSIELIRMSPREAVPPAAPAANLFAGARWMKKRATAAQVDAAICRGCTAPFLEREYFRGYTVPKSIVRVSPQVTSMRIHAPEYAGGYTPATLEAGELALVHFDAMSRAGWERKWRRRLDGTGAAEGMRPNRKRQMQLFRKCLRERSEQAMDDLFRRLYLVADGDREVLMDLAMLSPLEIDERLFGAGSPAASTATGPG